MPITGITRQSRRTLEEFYIEMGQRHHLVAPLSAKSMLSLLEMINDMFKTTQLWGMTSHDRLKILTMDDCEATPYIMIYAIANEYTLEYLMPPDKAPWEYARVTGGAMSLAEIRRLLIIAMHESEGWVGNEELEGLVKDVKG